jgi:excisionase family DNA binding protein
MVNSKPEMLNCQQACKLLACSRSHFYNLVNSGAIPSQRSGKTRGVRVKRSDCESYLKFWLERVEK